MENFIRASCILLRNVVLERRNKILEYQQRPGCRVSQMLSRFMATQDMAQKTSNRVTNIILSGLQTCQPSLGNWDVWIFQIGGVGAF